MRESKSGKQRAIPIDQTFHDVLRTLPSRFQKGCVFPSPAKQGFPMVDLKHTFRRLTKSAGIENVRFLVVRRGIVRGKINLTKSGKVRKVDVSDSLLAALLELRRNRKEALLAQGKNGLPAAAWIFENEEGGFQDMKNLKKRHFHKCLEKAGLRRIRFHDLRHTYASLLIQNNESLTCVKEQLGHSSIRITVDTYGHLVPGANRQAVNRLPSLGGFQALQQNEKQR